MAAASSEQPETECPVCANGFTTPKILPCGHLLCRQCVIFWVNLKSDAGCPLCRCLIVQPQGQSVPSPPDIADALPTDFAMEALVDSATVITRIRVCCACDDVKAEFFCMQCRDFLCSSCCKMHKKIPATRSHDVESLSSVTAELVASSRPGLCADHGKKQTLFCLDHGVPVCTTCIFNKHAVCRNRTFIATEITSAEKTMKRLTDILLNAERELELSIAEVDKRLQEVIVREQEDITEIDKACVRLQKMVDDFRKKIKVISRNSHSEVKKSLHDMKSSLGKRLAVVTSHKRIMSRTSATAPRHTLIHATKALQDRINSLDLSADLKLKVWGDSPSYGTRCHDVIWRIEKELQVAAKRITDLQETISPQAQTFWLQWVETAFPDLDFSAYFLPPVHVNHVTVGQSSAAQPPPVHDSDLRDDSALQRVFYCLQKLSERNAEVLVAMSQLQFGQHLGQPCYSAAAACLLESSDLRPALVHRLSSGDFDVLLIHRQYGLVAVEIKCVGDGLQKTHISQLDLDNSIRRNLKDAVSQLSKTKAILSHLVSDIAPDLRITKTIALPNLTSRQVQQAISGDPELSQNLCCCLGTTNPADITGLCLCSDHLSNPKTPWDVSNDIIRKLGNWWKRRVAVSGPDSHMTYDSYKGLVARLCGPATTVTVPCTSPPRLYVKTLGQAVSWTGECYTAQITLFPEQIRLLNMAHPRVFVAGPPGTGKTVVLLLKATEWLRCGEDVHIVSIWLASRTACSMLYHLLVQIVNTQLTSVVSHGQPHLLLYDFCEGKDVEKAVNDLSLAAKSGSLHVIADEAGAMSRYLQTFCDKLLTQVPRLHLWAASCYHRVAPTGWHVECLTRPLRSPATVVREVQQAKAITVDREVKEYSERGVADHTDDPQVRRLYHRGHGHSSRWPYDCVTCGREVASFLHNLRAGLQVNAVTTSTTVATNSNATPPVLQWRDVLVLFWSGDVSEKSGVVTGLREAAIPVRVMEEDDDTEDVVTAHSDVVWVANGVGVLGLERKIVVCLQPDDDNLYTFRLLLMSRCMSQLVIVSL